VADHIPARRRAPDPLTLLAGLAALLVSVTALVGSSAWLPSTDLRWVLAVGAVTIGVLLLLASLRPRR